MGSVAKKNVLIIGASGIVGKSAVEEFVKSGEWNVYGISRTYPSILSAGHSVIFQHTPLDLFDQKACADVLPHFNSVTHILYCALIEQPGDLTESWLSVKNGNDNVQMMKNCMSILLKECKNLEHVQWLQGTKVYGVHYRSVLVPLREHENIDPNPDNWYWKQEAYMLDQLKGTNIRWSIFRPCCIWFVFASSLTVTYC
jgi:nucleoside-diphosphate-sugar epimerase